MPHISPLIAVYLDLYGPRFAAFCTGIRLTKLVFLQGSTFQAAAITKNAAS